MVLFLVFSQPEWSSRAGGSPMLGNISGGNVGRNIASGGGLSATVLASHLNLSTNSGSGNLNVEGPNRLMGSMRQQASPQVMSMLGNSYPSAGGPLSQNHIQAVNNLNSMGMMNDVNSMISHSYLAGLVLQVVDSSSRLPAHSQERCIRVTMSRLADVVNE
ncbi:general transcription factor [Lithospermum erythrorhizon]|uniref:General transcription factor n=1 Tax=Lithospermum erythrorhizon TaxID=34254 RepID=A0AAV3P4T5_LITER